MDTALRANLIHELFDAAVQLPAEQRSPFLLAMGAEASVRVAVFGLLEAHDRARAFLADPTVPPEQIAAQFGPQPGTRLDRYTVLQRLGEGGHGTVYLAQQDLPNARRVALKVIKAGMDTGQVVARFNRERESLARMDHPNVARVYDAGVTEAGRPFFAMEWVDGDPITVYCRRQRLGLRQTLELFATVCAAVQHAHERGILHRDLKPANVLVNQGGGTVTPKVIDFGIAKAMAADDPGVSMVTLTMGPQFLGTPQYMSPEQADPLAVLDARTDVYGLGGLLYELLTGSPPLDRSAFAGGDLPELARVLREAEPVLPSVRLAAAAGAARAASPDHAEESARAAEQVRGALDWVVAKALSKDRDRRYVSAAELAADVKRYLAGERVVAAGTAGRSGVTRWVVRHRGIAGAVAGTVAAAAAVVVWLALRPHPAAVAPPRGGGGGGGFVSSVRPPPPPVAPDDPSAVRVSYVRGKTEVAELDENVPLYSNRDASFATLPAPMLGLPFTRRDKGATIGVTVDVPAHAAVYLVIADGTGAAPSRDAARAAGWVHVGNGRLIGPQYNWGYEFFGRVNGPPAHVRLPGHVAAGIVVVAANLVVAPSSPVAASTTADQAPPVRVVSARWGGGAHWSDVTARVAALIAAGQTVWADPTTLGEDPTPGWKKHLEVVYAADGEEQSARADEGRALIIPELEP